MSKQNDQVSSATGSPVFRTTLWGVVRIAGGASGDAADAAVEQLCRIYWYPIYAYARRGGHPPAEAEDLTQEFFGHLLRKNFFGRANAEAGRFRSFLLTSFKNFAAQARIREQARKRGGDAVLISFDAQDAEARYRLEPPDIRSADRLFDRRWAVTLIERVMQQLEAEMQLMGKGAQFERLQHFLPGDRAHSYAEASRDLGLSEAALRVAVHRLRQRCRELFRAELAQTVAAGEDFEAELRYVLQVLAE